MSLHVDPPRTPLPPVAQALAEAALQRQNMLLGTDREGSVPPSTAGSPVPGAPPGTAPPLPAPPPLPVGAERVSISPQARQSLESTDGAANGARTARAVQGPATAPVSQATAQAGARPMSPLAPAALLATAWPATGVGAPVRSMVAALVQQLTAPALPQRVAGIQPWPADLARQVLGEGGPEGTDAALAPLQTWRVGQGTVQTAEGPRGFALTLRVPVPWLAAQPLSQGVAAPAAPLQVPFTGNPQALQSGVFALVLEGPGAGAPRTSALLVLDFAPPQGAAVYGREQLLARMDPWTQMAVLQASGQVPREEDRARGHSDRLCETAGCPYAGRAACVQPFCVALRWTEPLVPVVAITPTAQSPD